MKKLVVAVAVIAGLGALSLAVFGDSIRQMFGVSAQALGGDRRMPIPPAQSKARMMSFASGGGGDYGGGGGGSFGSSPARLHSLSSGAGGNTSQLHAPTPTTDAREDRFSTFALDVDTASYTLARRALRQGHGLHPSSVRVEEWVNYFGYARRPAADRMLNVHIAGAVSPFRAGRHLVAVTVDARRPERRKPAHLVFLVDVSGSMSGPDRLELAKRSMEILLARLGDDDTVGIVTYAGDVRQVLSPTSATRRRTIRSAIASLSTGGGTAMGDGLELAYEQAAKQVRPGHVSRVIVLTDGDTNLGRNLSAAEMLSAVKGYVAEGVTLSTVGFGMGNYRDDTMERLADNGNGNCVYIDSEDEAARVFGERHESLIEVAARDAKIQVEFDPKQVRSYRLIGYDNREVADRDFRNDRVDGGEVGIGHQVTALYEVELARTGGESFGAVHVRARAPEGAAVEEHRYPLERRALHGSIDDAPADFRFASAVATIADVLRGAKEAPEGAMRRAVALAAASTGGKPARREFVALFGKDGAVSRRPPVQY